MARADGGLTIEPPTFCHPRTDESVPCLVLPAALSAAIAPEPKGDAAPRLYGQLWMIRRFTSARLLPQSAGAKQKNHSGSGHYGIRRVALWDFIRNGIFCRKRQESGDKRLRFSPDAAVEKWPLRGSPATSRRRHWPTLPRQSLCSSPMEIGVRQYAGGAVMSDGLSKLYHELLSGSYDCVDPERLLRNGA